MRFYSRMICAGLLGVGLISMHDIHAAVPPSKVLKEQAGQEILMALRLPMENRILALKKRPGSFEQLKKMSFQDSQSLQTRWRALTAMARLDFGAARASLEKALQSDEWFMRNAALVTLVSGDKTMALKWSLKLLNDPALVVRTAAVQNLRDLKDRRAREDLLKAFRDPQNFKGGQSLWIRHHIARALSDMAIPGEEAFLIRLLAENDNRIHPWAIQGLERLTGKTLSESTDLKENKKLWLSWWESGRNS